jgi:hypothetical protein
MNETELLVSAKIAHTRKKAAGYYAIALLVKVLPCRGTSLDGCAKAVTTCLRPSSRKAMDRHCWGGERIVNGQTEEEEQLSRLFAYGRERGSSSRRL